jgi:hypothetical protein
MAFEGLKREGIKRQTEDGQTSARRKGDEVEKGETR